MERTRRAQPSPAPPRTAPPLLAPRCSTGCAAGFDATSIKPYAPSDGILANSGDLRVLNTLVVVDEVGDTASSA